MLTVKIISSDGSQLVREARMVAFYTPRRGERCAVQVYTADEVEPSNTVLDGAVYVMNERGKTVADYHLSPIGHEPEPPSDIEDVEVTRARREKENTGSGSK